jgi:hypothetical protein
MLTIRPDFLSRWLLTVQLVECKVLLDLPIKLLGRGAILLFVRCVKCRGREFLDAALNAVRVIASI